MNAGIIIQARTGSTRLPGKIMKSLPFGSETNVLQQVIRRCKHVPGASVIVATTTKEEDNVIEEVALGEKVNIFHGSEEDVLARYYEAAVENKLDIVVRVTSDCPCIDPEIIEKLIGKLNSTGVDYVSNVLERTYPHGLDAEAFTFEALEKAHKRAKSKMEREHVTFYMYSNKDLFKVLNIKAPDAFFRPDIRITLDTEEDYVLLSIVYDCLFQEGELFSTGDVVKLFEEKGYLFSVNSKVVQKKVCNDKASEIAEAIRVLDLQGLNCASDILRRS